MSFRKYNARVVLMEQTIVDTNFFYVISLDEKQTIVDTNKCYVISLDEKETIVETNKCYAISLDENQTKTRVIIQLLKHSCDYQHWRVFPHISLYCASLMLRRRLPSE